MLWAATCEAKGVKASDCVSGDTWQKVVIRVAYHTRWRAGAAIPRKAVCLETSAN